MSDVIVPQTGKRDGGIFFILFFLKNVAKKSDFQTDLYQKVFILLMASPF